MLRKLQFLTVQDNLHFHQLFHFKVVLRSFRFCRVLKTFLVAWNHIFRFIKAPNYVSFSASFVFFAISDHFIYLTSPFIILRPQRKFVKTYVPFLGFFSQSDLSNAILLFYTIIQGNAWKRGTQSVRLQTSWLHWFTSPHYILCFVSVSIQTLYCMVVSIPIYL